MKSIKINDGKLCIMCGQVKLEGLTINSGFICEECEQEIVKTDVSDEKYPYFIQKMKTLWAKDA